jgi:predicted transcriptional regulator
MAKIKISSKVEQREWEALQAIASESNQSIAGLLSEAVADYVRKRRLRPEVLSHLEDSMNENEELGRRLAK